MRKYRNVLRLQNLRTATIVAFKLDDGTNLTENVFDRLQEAKFNALDKKVACRGGKQRIADDVTSVELLDSFNLSLMTGPNCAGTRE